jgi:hypothetical protein
LANADFGCTSTWSATKPSTREEMKSLHEFRLTTIAVA